MESNIFTKVIPVNIQTVRSLPAAGFMLTEDENVVRVEMEVQYRVIDPKQYLFSTPDPDQSLTPSYRQCIALCSWSLENG